MFLSACGGHDQLSSRAATAGERATTTVATAFVEWSSDVDQDCAAADTTYAHLDDAEPTTSAAAVRHADEVDQFARAIRESVRSHGSPTGHESAAKRLRAQLDALASATKQLADAATAGDGASVTVAVAKITELGAEINPVTIELAVPACGGF